MAAVRAAAARERARSAEEEEMGWGELKELLAAVCAQYSTIGQTCTHAHTRIHCVAVSQCDSGTHAGTV
jgi:hypothetical protein